MRKVLLGFTSLVVVLKLVNPYYTQAEWHSYNQIQASSEYRHILRFDRYNKGPIRAWLLLAGKQDGAFQNKLPVYRVDENPLRKVEGSKKIEKKEGTYVLWEIDDGKQPPGKLLLEFIEGKRVVFQYYIGADIIRETVFDLSGLKESIQKLL